MTITSMTISEIKQYLHHRYPFLLIDGVECVEPGKHIVAWKNLSNSDPIFEGHFPNKPIYPGVMCVEALCQASCILGFITLGITKEDDHVYLLSGLDKVRFKGPMLPGDRVMLYAELTGGKLNFYKFKCYAKVNDKEVCSAEILCSTVHVDNVK